jgi:hypothetical protein
MTSGWEGLELIKILEAASASLKANGAPINLVNGYSTPGARMLRAVATA